MQVSVVVPTFNRRDVVLRTIKTLFDQSFPAPQYEIIVVVDGSTDGSAAALRTLHPACRLRVIEQENLGLAGARNTGWRAADGELIIFLDDDMLCDPMLVREHCIAHRPNQAAVGFGAIFLSPESPPSLAAECFNREVGAYHLQHKQNPEIPWPRSACMFGNTSVPRRLLIDAGGFDERFRMREDAELGARLFAAGVEPRYLPTAVAYQFYRKTAGDLIRDAEAFAVADRLFLREHPELASDTFLGRIAIEPLWKRLSRRTAAACPTLTDVMLAPFCWLGEAFPHVKVLRQLGVRALQVRRGIHWYHKTLEQRSATSSPGELPLDDTRGALELLVAVSGEYVSGADRGAAVGVATHRDLAFVADLARNHGVLPLLARALRTARLDDAAIQQSARQLAFHNLRLSAELLDVIAALAAAGIDALAYKGPALAQQLYGDVSLRQFFDLDIVVAPDEVPRALDILHRRGYADRVQLGPRLLQCEWQLAGTQSGTVIELHWAAFPKYFSLNFPVAEIRRAAARVTLAGRSVPVPAPDDLFLLLCAHGTKHFWCCLGWLVDIALVLRGRSDDAIPLLRLAEKKGVRRILLLSVALVAEVLRLELPIAFSDGIRRDPALPPLVAIMAQSLYAGKPPADKATEYCVLLCCRERWSDRIRTMLRLAFTPGPQEWQIVPLPRFLGWMYPLVRLVRSLRYLPRLVRRASVLIRAR